MLKLKKLHLIFILVVMLMMGCASIKKVKAQQQTDKEQIIGTWIPEGSPHIRLVFSSDGTLEKYKNDNELYKTYYWSIEKRQSPSGLTFNILHLKNIHDSNDKVKYLIDTISDNRLVLVYNTGVGPSRTAYIRQ